MSGAAVNFRGLERRQIDLPAHAPRSRLMPAACRVVLPTRGWVVAGAYCPQGEKLARLGGL